jgi:RNA polymerase sigma factor (sigma-70 family)
VEEGFDRVLAGARTGAEWAWADLYRGSAPAVFGYLRARGASEPGDLLGEVFLQVVRDLHRFRGGEREFRAWVFRIAHNRLVDDVRRRRRRPNEEPIEDFAAEGARVADGEEEALAALADQHVRRIFSHLSPDQQSVLLLRILGDLTVEQVARVLGKRPGAVKALQRRGLATLARELEKEGVTL